MIRFPFARAPYYLLAATALVSPAPFYLVAASAIVSPAYGADVTITSPGSFTIGPGQSVEFNAEGGATTGSFAQVNAGVRIGTVTATAPGTGVLSFAGNGGAVDGSVSNLFRVTIGTTGATEITGTVTNTGAFYTQAGTLTVGGNFQNSYVNFTSNSDGTLVLNGATNSISTVLMTGSTGSVGTITLGAGSATTFTGAVGGTARLKRLNLNGALVTFSSNVGAEEMHFGADGTASVRGATFNSSVSTATDGTGILSFQPSVQTTANGTIGSASHALKRIELKSGTGSIVRITQAAFADAVLIDGLGTLIFDTASALETSVGSATAASGPAVIFSQDGLLSISNANVRIGTVTTSGGTAGQGRITFAGSGAVTFGAGIGTATNALKQITISNAGATIATAPASENHVATVRLSADGVFRLAEGSSLAGDVTTASHYRGTVVFGGGGSASVTGDIGSGAASLKAVQFGSNGSGTVNGNIFAETLSFQDAASTLTVSGNIVGRVQGASGGGGALTFGGTTTTGGDIGIVAPLRSVAFRGAGTSTLQHDIDASAPGGSGVVIGTPGTTLSVATTGRTITGSLSNLGTLDLGANTLTVAGNISGTGSIAFTVGASGSGYIVNTTNTANYAPGAGTVTIIPTVTGTTIADGTMIALIRGATGTTAPSLAATAFTVSGASGLTWTVVTGADYAGSLDFNGHLITAADTILVAGASGGSPGGPPPPPPPPGSGVIDTSRPNFTDGDDALTGAHVTFAGGVLKPTSALNLPQAIDVTAANGTIDPNGNAVTLSGPIAGTGVLTVDGPGRLIVTSDVSNAGGLMVQQGELVVGETGRVAAPVVIGRNGTLGGTGTIAGLTQVAGVLAPGNSPGILSFAAPVNLTPSSTYRVEIDGPAAGNGSGAHDKVILAGAGSSFSAAGTLSPVLRGITGAATNTYTPAIGQAFEVVSAEGGVRGAFDTLAQPTDGLPAGTRFDAIYGSTTITLAVTPDSYGDLARAGLSQTTAGRAAGAALDAMRPAAGSRVSDEAQPFYDALYTLSGARAADAVEQLSGTLHADTLQAALANRRMFGRVVETRQAVLRGGDSWTPGGAFALAQNGSHTEVFASAAASPDVAPSAATVGDRGWSVWGKPLLAWGRTDSDANAPGSTRKSGGLMVGAEGETAYNVTAGVALGHLYSAVESAAGRGTGKVNTSQATLYANWTRGGTFVDAALGYGYSAYDTNRRVAFGGFAEAADSEAHGHDWSAEVGAGHRLSNRAAWLEPRAGLRWERIDRNGFAEEGSDLTALSVAAETLTALRSSIGVRAGTVVEVGGWMLEPTALLAWEHDFRDIRGSGRFSLAGTDFAVDGADPGRDAAVIGIEIGVRLSTTMNASIGYSGELRKGDTAHAAAAGLRISF